MLLPSVQTRLSRVPNLSLRVLQDLTDPFEVSADVGTVGMESPAAHLSQFATDLSESHLDVAQPAVYGGGPAEVTPPLLGLIGCSTSHDPNPPCGSGSSLTLVGA